MHRTSSTLFLAIFLAGAAGAAELDVLVEEGARVTSASDEIAYTLFVPVPAPGLAEPPWPSVVLTHGFARSRRYHRDNARYLAERGVLVLTPDMVSLLGGPSAQRRNVANTADHVRWLVERSETPGDALEGRVDRSRLGLAGHSAGAAVSFEAAVELASSGTPAEALALLDGVPWPRTERLARKLPPMDFASFTSEPSPCNAFGNVRALHERLAFPSEDVRIAGATHCDPENPTDVLCKLACGGGSAEGRARYQELMGRFFDAAFGRSLPGAYENALAELERRGAVVRSDFGPDVAVRLSAVAERVTADVFARPTGREARWYFGFRAEDGIFWVTEAGIERRPGVFARFEPTPIDDLPLLTKDVPSGETTFFLFALDEGGLVAWNVLRTSGEIREAK